jgi:hypothetical protein
MSQYYKLNESADPDDIQMIISLVGMGVLQEIEHDDKPSTEVLREMAAYVWIFEKSERYTGGASLTVSQGDIKGTAECRGLQPGNYFIIPTNR